MRTNRHFDFTPLTAAERIELAQELWESLELAELEAELPLSDEERAELDRRLEDYEQNPDAGTPWEEVRARLIERLQEVRRRKRGA